MSLRCGSAPSRSLAPWARGGVAPGPPNFHWAWAPPCHDQVRSECPYSGAVACLHSVGKCGTPSSSQHAQVKRVRGGQCLNHSAPACARALHRGRNARSRQGFAAGSVHACCQTLNQQGFKSPPAFQAAQLEVPADNAPPLVNCKACVRARCVAAWPWPWTRQQRDPGEPPGASRPGAASRPHQKPQASSRMSWAAAACSSSSSRPGGLSARPTCLQLLVCVLGPEFSPAAAGSRACN